ncbi:radical SAM domain protein [Campylobacter lari]|uniref:Wyosine [tRNA(Phe)-imidazoG37] synthetase, radical SAM superfamily n=1 Tax=Campylobacter lari NCTC 11845 TaxID=1388749 RepID=A0A0A8HUC0_CAMLA|nr:radical SAM protein [Campylobacter lari]AJD01417.1 wyosine [tRNA(Phe)-imidazoG37] synthetase, radical SAM superfamily [Campylobacter lari NCTC 11845]EAK0848002.1 radical SAM protein [Campylobacter lari]EAK0979180.1 radical SAM protein [Campylobacter lari]EAK9953713.1 radical SAM protein [Campylobacter lari]MCR6543605.1 radical SAM protein [Campylobacter lari]
MNKITFGPISSRRFGLSLGIDLSPNQKQCNFDCVYCELQAAKPIEKFLIYPKIQDITEQVKQALASNVKFDFLTLTANGEPSLYPYLKELVYELNKIKQDKKLLILSNGSGVLNINAFDALMDIDVVKFSLDSAIEKTFYRIDRTLKQIKLETMIEKMIIFGKKFPGELIMEVLVVQGLNDSKEEMLALNEVFDKIKPLRVDFSTIDRPPAYPVKGVSLEKLEELSMYITSVPIVLPKRYYKGEKIDFNVQELLKMLQLRAQSEFDIENKFSQHSKDMLEKLIKEHKVVVKKLAGVNFYKKI